MAKKERRGFFKTIMVSSWVAPMVMAVSIPGHAQTSECFSPPVIPPPIPDVTISDNAGSPIDAIDLSDSGTCAGHIPACSNYTATGLPSGLAISSAGIIAGTYNATGTEAFPIQVYALRCGEISFVGDFTLTMTDAG